MKRQPASKPAESLRSEIITKEDVADILGVNPRTVESMTERGDLPVIRLSPRLLRFNRESVMKAIMDREIPTRTT